MFVEAVRPDYCDGYFAVSLRGAVALAMRGETRGDHARLTSHNSFNLPHKRKLTSVLCVVTSMLRIISVTSFPSWQSTYDVGQGAVLRAIVDE